MLPAAAPADQILKLPGEAAISWAVFDAEWYLGTYPAVRGAVSDLSPADLLRHYLHAGQKLGHAPNRYFDEAFYRGAYPSVATGIGNDFASGFDHYCRTGYRTHSPHWLFDATLYRQRNPDLSPEALAEAGLVNGYDHYLRHGARERRIASRFFDPAIYLARLDRVAAEAAASAGPFQHYLGWIEAGGAEPRTTLYFDPDWYLARYPGAADAIRDGRWRCALHHNLANPTPTAFDH
jgi:hypothetical protein